MTAQPQPTPNEHAKAKRQAPWVYEAIQAGQRYHFRSKTPWIHNAINLGSLALLLAGVAGLLAASRAVHPAIYVPVAGLLFGLVYFGLFVLVVHEASHGMFVIARDKKLTRTLNRAFGYVVAGIFAVNYRTHWEVGHLEHHVRPLEPTDPQRFSIAVGPPLVATGLKYLFIPLYLYYDRLVGRSKKMPGRVSGGKWPLVAFILFWGAALTTAGLTLGWAAPVAMFWGIHVVSVWNLVKGGLEHGGAIGEEANSLFRSRTTMFFGRRLLMPFNITLHFEHHLNFTVPWYDLLRYQRDLEAIVPAEVWRDVVNHRPLAQLTDRLGGLSEQARATTAPA